MPNSFNHSKSVDEMNDIYAGVIAPVVETSADVDWEGLGAKCKAYGAAEEEIWLRARTIDALNKG